MCIHITNDEHDNGVTVAVTNYKKKGNRIIRRLQQSDLEVIHQKYYNYHHDYHHLHYNYHHLSYW